MKTRGSRWPAVAKALWDLGGNSRADIAGALAKGIGGKYADMASAILGIPSTNLGNVAYGRDETARASA